MGKCGQLLTVHRLDARRSSTLLMYTHLDLKKALHQALAKTRLLRSTKDKESASTPFTSTDAGSNFNLSLQHVIPEMSDRQKANIEANI